MLKLTLKKSVIGFNKKQKATVKALGLGKINSSAVQAESPAVLGMIRKVTHLLDVQTLPEPVEDNK
ncbi:MAG: 50S ribosomal protein L30 [Armatimonadetes bacterium]|nr:50S ribosomal protein L30 [Armatimonadota bacterium]